METISRSEHLDWCKKRALEYSSKGYMPQAYASMVSDLKKHPETESHVAIGLGMDMLMGGHLNKPGEMDKFINGFN